MTTFPTVRALAVDAGVQRVVVGGMNLSDFRADSAADQPVQVPGYTLTEPFAYGASRPLTIPRTNALLGDEYGAGDLSWLHNEARVLYQRVYDAGTEDEEIVTDYRGFISAIRTAPNGNFVAEVSGEVSGRAALADKPPALIRKVYDLGSLMKFAADTFGLHFTRPTTGLTAPNAGGMTWLAWMSQVGALSRTAEVNQRAFMPTVWGGTQWAFEPRDTTTVDFTVYADGQRIAVDLVDDLAEQPNSVYGNGVSTTGERWRGARYPGFFQGTPAPYPFLDDSDFGTGTTDADTDTGDGITVMVKKLAWTGYLNDAHSDATTFDVYVARAVLHLQEDAGLTADGVMTPATWLALWDADVVGFSPEGARIFPLAQEARVRSWNYSSTGAIIGRNPLHQAGAIRVDRTIDYGVCDKELAISHARSLIRSVYGHQWTGTITLNSISVFSGEHDDTDAADLTTADLMRSKDIRPGMNAWLPYFDGGTLLHVSGVDVNGDTVTLYVSSAALDIFDLTQALQRNAESKRSPYRERLATQRGFKPPHNYTSRDEFFGKLYTDVDLVGGHWNVVPILMGQSGTVSYSDIRLTNTACEFAWAVFNREMHAASMDGYFGSPFTVDDDGLSTWEHQDKDTFFEQQQLLIVQGTGQQPAGYGWRVGYDADGNRTENPLIGTDLDASTWTYNCDPSEAPVVYLCIYPRENCTLRRGRLFYALEDDAT